MAVVRDNARGAPDGPAPELRRLLGELEALEAVVAGWDEQQRGVVAALKGAIDALNREALARLIRAVKREPAALAVLREAVSDEVVYAVLRHHELVKASLDERVERALASVRPFLRTHGGDVELVSVDPPDAITVRLLGACDGCPASGITLTAGVEKAVQEACPEIRHIHKASGLSRPASGPHTVHFVSPFAREDDTGWLHAASLSELPHGGIVARQVEGVSVLLGCFDDTVVCYGNACAHLGLPLDMADVDDGVLVCPHHGFAYSLRSGECLTVPEVQLQTHAVRVLGEQVQVKLS